MFFDFRGITHTGFAALMKSALKPGYEFDQLLVLGTHNVFLLKNMHEGHTYFLVNYPPLFEFVF